MSNLKDLSDCSTPDEVPAVLRAQAQRMREDRAELQAAWNDRMAGADWELVARALEVAAATIERKMGVVYPNE